MVLTGHAMKQPLLPAYLLDLVDKEGCWCVYRCPRNRPWIIQYITIFLPSLRFYCRQENHVIDTDEDG